MSASVIGSVKHNGKVYEVKWNSYNGETYVSYAGWSYVGKASKAIDAISLAQSYLYNK